MSSGPLSAAERFGRELVVWRAMRGKSQAELARYAHCDQTWVSAIELGKRLPTEEFAKACDEFLEAPGVFERMYGAVVQETADVHPDWFRHYAEIERKARRIRSLDNGVMPGLLQTEEYMRALIASHTPGLPREVEAERIAARMARQAVLRGEARVEFLLEEGVLRRQVGGPAVMARQLRRVLEMSHLPNVGIHALPFELGADAGSGTSLRLVESANGRQVLYSESLTRGHVITDAEEISSWDQLYHRARARALNADDSRRLISSILRGMVNMLPAAPPAGPSWRKSSYSGANGGDCVEVARLPRTTPVRDSKDPHGPALAFPAPAFAAFLAALTTGTLTAQR
ncbi:Scr1 family TA system antitoxin-like transcriptional regulator [Kitasatospora sp. RB6PN24]|uniref:helix-turn-helix domain-containing protein n=1 Tax=Kitasatospora humi TaxID=2893891 RepID=UPI001E6445FD|nr:Scr1 family TA system antitoxin-like transcriptional regulator [Kitasatospora humi]MCC9311323.1 Scr1 family TA system antitoxin-like transcriptional regulator [Kitasatospora humi]